MTSLFQSLYKVWEAIKSLEVTENKGSSQRNVMTGVLTSDGRVHQGRASVYAF